MIKKSEAITTLRTTGLVAVVAVSLAMSGCAALAPSRDAAGLTEKEVSVLTLEEQYELASTHWVEFNERFAQIQSAISEEEWAKDTTHFEVVPFTAGVRADRPRGANGDNSYYFMVYRELETGRAAELLGEITEDWVKRFSRVQKDERDPEEGFTGFVEASTSDGFSIEAYPTNDGIGLSALSPVYWASDEALLFAIGDRRAAEDEAGVWAPELREDGTSLHLPGDYRPFPKWETEPTEWNYGLPDDVVEQLKKDGQWNDSVE